MILDQANLIWAYYELILALMCELSENGSNSLLGWLTET